MRRRLPTPPLYHEPLESRDWIITILLTPQPCFSSWGVQTATPWREKREMETLERPGDVAITHTKISLSCGQYACWKGESTEANSITLHLERSRFEFQLHYFLAWPQASNWTSGHICLQVTENPTNGGLNMADIYCLTYQESWMPWFPGWLSSSTMSPTLHTLSVSCSDTLRRFIFMCVIYGNRWLPQL